MPITLPDLGSDRAVVSVWYVREGERVYEGDRVVEVLFPGATFDVPTPASGTLRERIALPSDPVSFGQLLGTVELDLDL